MINRGPVPVQQQQVSGQQQYQPINRAPLPQQVQIPQQRPPQLVRTPSIPPQAPNSSLTPPVNPSQTNYQAVQNRPIQPTSQQQYTQNLLTDGQAIRLSQSNQQYRPQIQTQLQSQTRPINPVYNSNIQKLPTHLEVREKMATEAANPTQPSYIISNSDDVDDVIVRPIGNVSKILVFL